MAGETKDLIQRYLFLFGEWEPNLTRWIGDRLRPGDVFIDVGANIGYYSLLASSLVGDSGAVVAIEASPATYQGLVGNIGRNGVGNVRALNVAASDVYSLVRMYRAPANNIGSSSLFEGDGFSDEGEIMAAPLAELLTAEDIQRARIIKIDVEGFEVAVIRGLLPALVETRRDLEIIVEIGGGPGASAPSATAAARQIIPLMAAFGFHVYHVTNDYSPHAYVRSRRSHRPSRVRTGVDTFQECDLIFSRKSRKRL